jgi:signal transduction histidine kinase
MRAESPAHTFGAMIKTASLPELPTRADSTLSRDTLLLAREQLAREQLSREQEALRRLAIAGAYMRPPEEVFAAVAAEIKALLSADNAAVERFDPDGTATVVAGAGPWMRLLSPIGMRLELDDPLTVTTQVHRTGRSARVDDHDYPTTPGPLWNYLRRDGSRSTAGAPIIVEGAVWGAVVVSRSRQRLPGDTEARLANFAELVGTVIANAEQRAELVASRARAVAAADQARRTIQRDLHDGAQQRLVSAIVTLTMAREAVADGDPAALELLDDALRYARTATTELRELARGILPSILISEGLAAAVETLVADLPLPVSCDIDTTRLPQSLETNAYFIVAEAVTNVVKHAHATRGRVAADVDVDLFTLEVRDDGVGGARTGGGNGLLGLRDRAAALGGDVRIDSPPGQGTVVTVTLPIPR